jgi:hypothetical protein
MPSLAADLAAAFVGGPAVKVDDTGAGYLRANVAWPNGAWAKLDIHPQRVYWYSLRGRGSARRLKESYEPVKACFAARGVHRFECGPLDDASRGRLLALGPWTEFVGDDGFTYLAVEF